ncbi:unnamed protein product [Polarella glacialis]|uniref:Thioesterase domain-containing protein n=1 Tax=Polarella glacialis TaxID=89957 RepID=A0A813HK52_POLGL|nr:unnamed protein product [Polarella glacialis]
MRRENFFHEDPNFRCFGCSPKNATGLQLQFLRHKSQGEFLVRPQLKEEWCSFRGILHGGMLATMFDEVAYSCILMSKPRIGLTTKMSLEYREPVSLLPGDSNFQATCEIAYAFPGDKVASKVLRKSAVEWLRPHSQRPMGLKPIELEMGKKPVVEESEEEEEEVAPPPKKKKAKVVVEEEEEEEAPPPKKKAKVVVEEEEAPAAPAAPTGGKGKDSKGKGKDGFGKGGKDSKGKGKGKKGKPRADGLDQNQVGAKYGNIVQFQGKVKKFAASDYIPEALTAILAGKKDAIDRTQGCILVRRSISEAVKYIGTKPDLRLAEAVQRRLFGLHTRAERGAPPPQAPPGENEEQWLAWSETAELTDLGAMREYLDLAARHVPDMIMDGLDGMQGGQELPASELPAAMREQLEAAGIRQASDRGSAPVSGDVFEAAREGGALASFLPSQRDAVDSEGLTPLIHAVDAERADAVAELLLAGANPSLADAQGAILPASPSTAERKCNRLLQMNVNPALHLHSATMRSLFSSELE